MSFIAANKVYTSTNKTQSFESRQNSSSFLPGVNASLVYMRALALGCFYSHIYISTQTFRRALTASLDSCAKIKSAPFSGVTKSGRVWRKVQENNARSVGWWLWFADGSKTVERKGVWVIGGGRWGNGGRTEYITKLGDYFWPCITTVLPVLVSISFAMINDISITLIILNSLVVLWQ